MAIRKVCVSFFTFLAQKQIIFLFRFGTTCRVEKHEIYQRKSVIEKEKDRWTYIRTETQTNAVKA